MTEIATLTFKAKRTASGAYKVPTFTGAHVATPRTGQGMRHTLMFNSRVDDALARGRQTRLLDLHGIPPYYVEESDARPGVLDIRPMGNGFMAEITLTIDLARKAA